MFLRSGTFLPLHHNFHSYSLLLGSKCQADKKINDCDRYLTATNKAYYETLSSASKKSLEFQGGPFKGAELETFETDPLRDEMVKLRLWDDAAKVQGIEESTPRAGEYRDLIRVHLEGVC